MLKAEGAGAAMAAIISVGLLLWLNAISNPALASDTECRSPHQGWQPCELTVQEPGRRWQVRQGSRLWQLQHDGSGIVQQREGDGRWQAVEPHWRQEGELCWGHLCARGAIPLD
tara:strand:+ start:833 stop:1174 length:342 start_codon:yes stop_codon:yes gene_type:complete